MSKKRALLAIGSQPWQERFTKFLHRKFFEVHTIADGLESIEIIRHQRFDLIIADESMQKAGPIELILNLKDLQIFVPAVLVTGSNMEKYEKIWKQCKVFFVGSRKAALHNLDDAIRLASQNNRTMDKASPDLNTDPGRV